MPFTSVKYLIGTSGIVTLLLPDSKQEPDCEFEFDKFEIKEITSATIDPELAAAAVTLDNTNKAVKINTEDYQLTNHKVKITVSIVQTYYAKAEDFILEVDFEAIPPEFDKSSFSAPALTCSEMDKDWAMKLPKITTLEISPVKASILQGPISSLFSMNSNIVTLSESGVEKFVAEDGCPPENNLELKFIL